MTKRLKQAMTYLLVLSFWSPPVWAQTPPAAVRCEKSIPRSESTEIGLSLKSEEFPGLEHLPEGIRGFVRGLLTFPVPVVPLWSSLKNKDKRFLVFVEKPLLGIVTTSIAVTVARQLTGSDAPWFRSFTDSWLSYTIRDIIGTGVALDPRFNDPKNRFSQWKAYFINYGYSVGSYSLVTTMTSGTLPFIRKVLTTPEMASSGDIAQASYGLSLITFAAVWPMFSQKINTMILPHVLLKRFPAQSVLTDIRNTSLPNEQILKKYRTDLDRLNAELAKTTNINEQKSLKQEIKEKTDVYLWVKWMRVGLEKGEKYPFIPVTVKKATGKLSEKGLWAIKTIFVSLVASGMVVTYFAARDFTVGTGVNDMAFLTQFIQSLFL